MTIKVKKSEEPERIYIDARQYDDYGLPIVDVTIDKNKSGRYGLWTENHYGSRHPKNCNIEYVLKTVADEKVYELEKEIISTRNNSVAMCIQAGEKAIKPIVEVYENYKVHQWTKHESQFTILENDLWQAIKATVKQFKDDEEKA